MESKGISVIIPALNEEATIKACLESAQRLHPLEIIVVDGGSSDRTREIAQDGGAMVLESQKGRSIQMNKGASLAKGGVLLFLHADSILFKDLVSERIFHDDSLEGCVGGFFRLAFDDNSLSTRLVEFFANTRSRLFSLPYGDQAIFVKKVIFEKIGCFKEYPFLEDIDMALRLRKFGKLKYIPLKVVASPRRLKRGYPLSPIFVSLRNVMIALLFLSGLSPFRLMRLYK